jgi:hypothetical protein
MVSDARARRWLAQRENEVGCMSAELTDFIQFARDILGCL